MKVAWNDRAPPGFIPGHAFGHGWRVIDLDTGRDVGPDVTWADDEEGLYEVLLRDAGGNLVLTPEGDVERETLAARLRIVPPPGKEEPVAGLSDAAAVRPDVVVAGGGPG